MTALEFLGRATIAERRMISAKEKVERCRASVERLTATLGSEHVSSTPDVTAQENAIIRLMEAKAEAAKRSAEYDEIENEISDTLDLLNDPIKKKILTLFYVKHNRPTRIAKEIHIARSEFYRHRAIALNKLTELLKTSDTFGQSQT